LIESVSNLRGRVAGPSGRGRFGYMAVHARRPFDQRDRSTAAAAGQDEG